MKLMLWRVKYPFLITWKDKTDQWYTLNTLYYSLSDRGNQCKTVVAFVHISKRGSVRKALAKSPRTHKCIAFSQAKCFSHSFVMI
jgi:hypothetical protein